MNHNDKPANRLAAETSPYLLQHAYNPVDWYPWSEEALERAKSEDRPILLSVGYSACHWCHVMERECFENEVIAETMNRSYVCIKVDREERPDIDAIYMDAVQLMTGQGGWPMTVFLTPDGKPFYGGTYFPPTDMYGRPGFPRILQAVADAWSTQRNDIEAQGAEIADSIQRGGSQMLDSSEHMLTNALLENALEKMSSTFDRVNGGFGAAPKFPQPANLDLLLRLHTRFKRSSPLEMAETTLQRMALGGIYDQLGGGFHRYSTDAVWLAPHFEKMLYDNAQLAQTYCRAYQVTGKQFYRDVAEETLEYVLREMTDPDTGAFYSAQDADSEGEEGRFFVWTPEQLSAALGEDAAVLFGEFFDVHPGGNWEGKSILRAVKDAQTVAREAGIPVSEAVAILDSARVTLMQLREQRVKPGLDDKSLTSWNALMLSAFALCGAAFDRRDFMEAAIRNATFLISVMSHEEDGYLRLLHTYRQGEPRLNGYLEDYAFLADALLELYQSTLDEQWLTIAERLLDTIGAFFEDPQDSSFYSTSSDHETLLHRPRDWDDNATPSGNTVALEARLKLALYRDDPEMIAKVRGVLAALVPVMEKHPYGFARLLGVVDLYLDGPVEITLTGSSDSEQAIALFKTAHRVFIPNRLISNRAAVSKLHILQQLEDHDQEAAAAYVCRGFTCSLPITAPDQLIKELSR